jgi:RNA-directed DNA polymerase
LAHAILAGELSADAIVERCAQLTGRRWRWLRTMASRVLIAFRDKPRPRHREVVGFLNADDHYQAALSRYGPALHLETRLLPEQKMLPVAAAANWNLPIVESIGELAFWLRLGPAELLWLADLKDFSRKNKNLQLRHYHHRILAKKFGNIRLIEAPKQHLKQIQHQILSEMLNRIPAHPAAHGFVPARSIRSFVAPHVQQHIVLRMDLQDFFPSISGARVQAAFRTAGYPEHVADLLGGLCSTATPHDVWQSADGLDLSPSTLFALRSVYARPHLPQGAPTSPALANLCAYRVDCRLTGLAQSANAQYTRYADDLAFSGDRHFAASIDSFAARAAAILLEEGFQVHFRKTRIMRQGTRQHLAGLVVNQHINTPRAEFDRLKAILNNCVRSGPQSQNRESHPEFQAHLAGRIAFVESINAAKGQRLKRIFDKIVWS